MKRRTYHPAHRPLRLERCEARRLLSASAPDDAIDRPPLDAFELQGTHGLQGAGWTAIDSDSAIVSIGFGNDPFSFTQAIDLGQLGLADDRSGEGFSFDAEADFSALQRELTAWVVNNNRGDAGWLGLSPGALLPTTDELGLGALEPGEGGIDPSLLGSSLGEGSDLTSFAGASESTKAEPLLPLPISDSPIERARPTAMPLERVAFVSKASPDARSLGAGMVDLAEVLFTPAAETGAPMATVAEADAPSLAARDAALAVESWVRTLPAPADLPTAEASALPAHDVAPIEARTLPERSAPERLLPARDRVSTAPSKAGATPYNTPTSQPWEERVIQPYGFLAISVTLVGGSVWASRRKSESNGIHCLERPRRGPRRID